MCKSTRIRDDASDLSVASGLDQFLTLKEPFSAVDSQERHRCSPYPGERYDHCPLQRKMGFPLLPAWMKERDNLLCVWIERGHIAALVAIAQRARIGQIALCCCAAMFAGQNVVNLMGGVAIVFVDQAILTPSDSLALDL